MPIHLNGKVYKTVIRPMIMYGAEASTLTRREEGLLESTENENVAVDTRSLAEG